MRIVLLGATGETGKEVLSQALKQGHNVTAVVRTPEKITIEDEKLKVIKGDIMNSQNLSEIFPEHDAVVSCLGFPRTKPVTGYSDSIKSITEAMRKANMKRLVTMTAWWSDTSTAARSGFFANWIIMPFLKPILTNMRDMEVILEKECSDIDYTVVRPPGLGRGALTGCKMEVAEDFLVDVPGVSRRTNRSDVAAFMLSAVADNKYIKKLIAITVAPTK